MDVAVVGAGVAGLTAAHLLRNAGHAVTVFERDDDASRTAGYRLHLDPSAVNTLRGALPGNAFESLLASGTGGEAFDHLAVLAETGKMLLRIPRGDGSLMIGRRPLRRILLRRWTNDIRWGIAVSAVQSCGPNRCALLDADGHDVATADVVVIADGTGSRLARGVTGRDTARPAGVIGIAGRTALTPSNRSLVPPSLWRGPGFVLGRHATTAFLAVHDPKRRPVPDGLDVDLEEPYLLWSLILDGTGPPTTSLSEIALAATAHWAVSLRELLRCSDPESVAAFTFYQPADLSPWPAGRVAVIGDAAHPIAPTAGLGASIAIADAKDLASALNVTEDPRVAIQGTQTLMLRRAAAAARSSTRILTLRAALRPAWMHYVAVHVLPLADAVASRLRPPTHP